MAEPIYDKSGKWLIDNEGKALAFLAGLRDAVACKSVQNDTVTPRQLPDGLLEVTRQSGEVTLLLVEFCTYPEERVAQQMYDDIQMVRQARGAVPDALALVLCPKGNLVVPEVYEEASPSGLAGASARWTTREMWKFDAEEMLASPDVGIVPWVPLMKFDGPPQPLLQRCRERIDKEGGANREGLLSVTRLLASLKFNEQPGLIDVFLRSKSMIQTPLAKQIYEMGIAARSRQMIEEVILLRFSKLSADSRARIEGVSDEPMLTELHRLAVVCPTKEAFVERLNQETTQPPKPKSSRGKRKA